MRSVVQLYPGPPLYRGAVAQLGERLVCNQEATGSIPVSSTNSMLGVKPTPSSVSYGLMEVAWRRTLGWTKAAVSVWPMGHSLTSCAGPSKSAQADDEDDI